MGRWLIRVDDPGGMHFCSHRMSLLIWKLVLGNYTLLAFLY